ncbi:DMT family transporter [Kaistia dalseonensis]|uniref:S-adenosylmethionine uptake transporter n=1 Tax=Kaistia dalseonensis TaxID=410840 RepID=A0ABU0H334_9HYPH|nr:DMT family transporter [Kaistia dalseonensis]MCX5494137.1 DMT family transporter [Kaistia dalseonensis]MDQ0436716.1 S-adenosylmethionine uptake transporter [Kaistia dalseonensis]
MLRGVAIGFLTYAVFSCADAAMKASGGQLHVFQLSFIVTIFSSIVVFFAKPKTEQWSDMFRMRQPGLVLLRAALGIVAGLFSAFAFTTLPLADAYSLLFLQPLFVAVLSAILLRESSGRRQLIMLLVGLAGVLLVVRPGFREVLPGHFAAIATALCGAGTLLVLRFIGRTERQVSLIGSLMFGSLLVNGILTIFVFRMPTLFELAMMALCGALAGFGHLGLMAATRYAPANRIGPTQYSQIIWAVVLGAIFFSEFPDWISLIGMAVVGLSGLFNFLSDRRQAQAQASGQAA